MTPRIVSLKEKKLVGIKVHMSLMNNLTGKVWGQFAPRIKEVHNRISDDKISMQIYPSNYYEAFSPTRDFEKWATVEVTDVKKVLDGLDSFILEGGLYAVFDYKGSSSDSSIYQHIFSQWLPQSMYEVDDRPHFEVLGEKYRNNDPESEEEIWIPIKVRPQRQNKE